MNIHQLIAKNKIKEAINELGFSEESVILSSRLNQANRDKMLGVITNEEYSIRIARITSSILSIVGDQTGSSVVVNNEPTSIVVVSLPEIYKIHFRRNREFAGRINKLIEEFDSYRRNQRLVTGYDPSGNKYKLLLMQQEGLLEEHQKLSNKLKDEKVAKILKFIDAPTPNYENLSEAWAICQGLGMSGLWITEALKNQPDDEDVKINIAEAIEQFVETI